MHEESMMHKLKTKGLKKGSVSNWAAITIGLAATAPAYSLAGALGYGAAGSGYQLPIIFIISVIPIYFVALSYKHLTTVAPDAGTIFTWGSKAIGPRVGWFGGWAFLLACVLAGVAATQISVLSMSVVFDLHEIPTWFQISVATIFIFSTTYLTALGAKESSRTTLVLTAIQFSILILLAMMLLFHVINGNSVSTAEPFSWEWLNPFEITSFDTFLSGFLIALFIFWGFDASLAMSEEMDSDSAHAGRSGVIAMMITVITYVGFSIVALAYAGIDADHESSLTHKNNIDSSITVLATGIIGSNGGLVAAVVICVSAFSSTISTIMPSARVALAMATYRAIPRCFAAVNKVTQTPKLTTWTIGSMTMLIYITLSLLSESIIEDTIHGVSIAVCTYYIIAALSCVFYFHRTAFNHWQTALSQVIFPAIAAIILIVVCILQAWNMLDPSYGSSGTIIGVGAVFVIGVVTLLLGFPLMFGWNVRNKSFFQGETLPVERAHMVSNNVDRK